MDSPTESSPSMEAEYDKIALSKTPAAWIEYVSKKEGCLPQWKFSDIQDEGVRLPSFKCSLTLDYKGQNLTAEAKARSKKEAKHAASKIMLNDNMKLTPKDYYELSQPGKRRLPSTTVTPPLPDLEGADAENETIDDDEDIGGNPVGDLHEYCQKLGPSFPAPVFEDKQIPAASPRGRKFEVTCTINGVTKSEKSKKKKQAKRRVAYQWLMFLKKDLKHEYVQQLSPSAFGENGDF